MAKKARQSTVRPDRPSYLQSLADELNAPANRIRNLIGDKHWPTDGAYREHLLASVVRRHCPAALIVARGFVVSDIDPTVVSREQDLLLVDTTREAPLFYEAGVVVSFPRNVIGAISVKSSPKKSEVQDAVATLNSLRTAAAHPSLEPSRIWCAAHIFGAPTTPSTMYRYVAEAIQSAPVIYRRPLRNVRPIGPDCLVAGPDLIWTSNAAAKGDTTVAIRGYSCRGLSTAFFLGQLLNHLSSLRDHSESDFGSLLSAAQPLTPPEYLIQA